MSPAGKAQCFAVQRGEITGRTDVNFWRLTPLFRELFARPVYSAVELGSLVELVQYGCSSLAKPEPVGVPMLRMNNLQEHGWDLSDLKYIEMGAADLDRYRLVPGDLLFNRTNSKELVGKCEMFGESGDWVFASYLIRVRLQTAKALPQFVSDFLSTNAGRLQIDRLSRQIIGMTNINAEELRAILLPLPPLAKQRELVAAMDAARAARRAKRAEADALLAGMDECVLQILGINIPARNTRTVFAVRYKEISRHQMGVSLYAPDLRDFIGALAGTRYPARRLGDEVILNPPTSTDELEADTPVSFIPMEAVAESAEGSVSLKSRPLAEVSKGYTPFNEGDVLWAKITPCMENGKSCVAKGLSNGVGFGSTEFHVLRPSSERVLADYLHSFLSLACFRRVARYAFTGSAGHQRVPEQFLAELPFPVPPISVQEKIVREAEERRMQARRLRQQAESDWQRAKAEFEAALLGKG